MFHLFFLHMLLINVDCFFSKSAEKYVRKGRLNWPEGATSRESIKAVLKLPRLQVCVILVLWGALLETAIHFTNLFLQNIVMQHVDHSAGDLIDLLHGLLRYDPSARLTAHEALRHPFINRDYYRRF